MQECISVRLTLVKSIWHCICAVWLQVPVCNIVNSLEVVFLRRNIDVYTKSSHPSSSRQWLIRILVSHVKVVPGHGTNSKDEVRRDKLSLRVPINPIRIHGRRGNLVAQLPLRVLREIVCVKAQKRPWSPKVHGNRVPTSHLACQAMRFRNMLLNLHIHLISVLVGAAIHLGIESVEVGDRLLDAIVVCCPWPWSQNLSGGIDGHLEEIVERVRKPRVAFLVVKLELPLVIVLVWEDPVVLRDSDAAPQDVPRRSPRVHGEAPRVDDVDAAIRGQVWPGTETLDSVDALG